MLLSKNAEINTKPELEIYADDVKCSHGATTGRLDADAFFYLRSRGIDANTARKMLLTAFAVEVLDSARDYPFYDWAREQLDQPLDQEDRQ